MSISSMPLVQFIFHYCSDFFYSYLGVVMPKYHLPNSKTEKQKNFSADFNRCRHFVVLISFLIAPYTGM